MSNVRKIHCPGASLKNYPTSCNLKGSESIIRTHNSCPEPGSKMGHKCERKVCEPDNASIVTPTNEVSQNRTRLFAASLALDQF
jgi:hypothetical protein